LRRRRLQPSVRLRHRRAGRSPPRTRAWAATDCAVCHRTGKVSLGAASEARAADAEGLLRVALTRSPKGIRTAAM
jgi:hypothetical protein